MVNHVQTLLLNESAATVQSGLDEEEYGYIDHSFAGVVPDRWVSGIYSFLFDGVDGLDARLARARALERFAYSPEMSWLPDGLDPRRTSRPEPPSSVFGFYAGMSSDTDPGLVSAALARPDSHLAFTPTGLGLVDGPLESAKAVFESSKEESRKFAALVCAVVLHLHASYERSLA